MDSSGIHILNMGVRCPKKMGKPQHLAVSMGNMMITIGFCGTLLSDICDKISGQAYLRPGDDPPR